MRFRFLTWVAVGLCFGMQCGAGGEEELDLTIEIDGLSDEAQAPADSQPELEFDLEAELGEPDSGFDQEDELELNLLDEDEWWINPRLVRQLGGAITLNADYRYSKVQYDDSEVQDNDNQLGTPSLFGIRWHFVVGVFLMNFLPFLNSLRSPT